VDAWLTEARDAVARASGTSAEELELTEEDVRVLLELARLAAHESGERTNAPLLCYLIGRAQGETKLAEVAAAVSQSTS
jgi:Domain of unknown function (DUF6457)